MKKKLKIAYYCSNRTIFPPPNNIITANADIMYEIVKAMIEKGHDVTIYASKGSSMKKAKIVDLRLPPHKLDHAYLSEEWVKDLHNAYRITYISELINNSNKYDIIHFHVGRPIFGEPFVKFAKCPIIFTIHENFVPSFGPLMNFFKKSKLISISNAQRKTFASLNYIATIYHGVHVENYPFNLNPKRNCIFLNRVSKEKGVELAIKAAQKSKIKLDIYGPGNENYLKKSVLPYLNKNISYKGMIKKYSKKWYKAYSEAKVLLIPIQWDEPFGLVMIEAMACGTPVIAFNRGSVPEIMKNRETGFVVKPFDKNGKPNIKGFVEAVKKLYQMPEEEYIKMRHNCRKHIEKNFTTKKMTDEHEKLYYKVLKFQK
ncbi:glycosyltransferase family 4 protein [Candidatus Parcubacteria bacterium]|nr:glycosyltransferase family 4 protein [Candidatus Parcubacteria bacterium]